MIQIKIQIKNFFIRLFLAVLIINLGLNKIIPFEEAINGPFAATNRTEFINQFNKTQCFNLLQTQLDFGYRIPGTPAHVACGDWMETQMEVLGTAESIFYDVHGVQARNILGKINQGYADIIIFAAHYDSRAVAEKDPSPSLQDDPIPGANDGGSGVAMMLELASILASSTIAWEYEFWFLFLDAEDQGVSKGVAGIDGWDWCEGSQWQAQDLVDHPERYFSSIQNLSTIKSFILFDMVGGTNLQFVHVSENNADLENAVFSSGRALGYETQFPSSGPIYGITDDHVYFAQQGIPSLDLIINFWDTAAGWPYHHTQGDNLDHISTTSLEITGKTMLAFVYDYLHPDANVDVDDFSPDQVDYSAWEDPTVRKAVYFSSALVGLVFLVIMHDRYKIRAQIKEEQVKEELGTNEQIT